MANKVKHPVSGLTHTETMQRCKAAIRYVWSKTTKVKHIREVRTRNYDPSSRFKFDVPCSECGRVFGQSEKIWRKSATGRGKRTRAYQVNHICEEGMPTVNGYEDLGAYAKAMIETENEILCIACHEIETKEQMKRKHEKKEKPDDTVDWAH